MELCVLFVLFKETSEEDRIRNYYTRENQGGKCVVDTK